MAKALVTVTLTKERDTKGTYVYKDNSDDAIVPSLYIRKSGISGDPPAKVKLTIEAA